MTHSRYQANFSNISKGRYEALTHLKQTHYMLPAHFDAAVFFILKKSVLLWYSFKKLTT